MKIHLILIFASLIAFSTHATAALLKNGHILQVKQSWSQEQEFDRTATVSVPNGRGPHPVMIALHGNGGNARHAQQYRFLDQYIRIGPQGYRNSWNIDREASKAPDVDFIKQLIEQLKTYANVDANRIVILGSSNGAALVNRLLIELNHTHFQTAIKLAGQLNQNQYHDDTFWYDPAGGNAYDTPITPSDKRRILSIVGSEDRVVPYQGGPGVKRYSFMDAQESLYAWAQQMGEKGTMLKTRDGIEKEPDVFHYSYLNGDVLLIKLQGAGHNLQPFSNHHRDGRVKRIIQSFLQHP